MSFLDRITALIPIGKKKEVLEYFFTLNISSEDLTAALWTIDDNSLKILDKASEKLSSLDDLAPHTDKLLDQVLGQRQIDPQKILFGVPSSWLSDDSLKEEKLNVLRKLVKELELQPMAYVESSHALIHFLEKSEGIPPTAILVEFEKHHLTVAVVRAGKLDGVKIISRGENSGADIEKALIGFTNVETLPSRILIFGDQANQLKNQLLSYPWMSKLSFLHFPKINTMSEDIGIKSVCFAGATEIDPGVVYKDGEIGTAPTKSVTNTAEDLTDKDIQHDKEQKENLGFMVGDVASQDIETENVSEPPPQKELVEAEDFEAELPAPIEDTLSEVASIGQKIKSKLPFRKFIPKKRRHMVILSTFVGALLLVLGTILLLPKAEVKIFVEPKILEKDATVIADPNQKTVDEEAKVIPGQIVDTEVSSSSKSSATGTKEIGNSAKGTIIIYNKTFESKQLTRGTQVSNSSGLKFSLDKTVNIASQSATESGITFGKDTAPVTASAVGADSNLPSGSELTFSGVSSSQLSSKAEGNFSGGSSKQVTVVSSDDQNKLLASLASSLKKQAQQQLQEKLPQKKILEEALQEEIIKKSFNKNVGDQANEFSLNLTSRYKGTAFEDKDLKTIISKLVVTDVPEGFKLNLEDTETQADVSKLEKSGKLIFLARFRAKLMPKIDEEKIKNQIRGKSLNEAINVIRGMENVLGAEIKVSPSVPLIQIVPILNKNIKIEVGLK